MIVDHSDRLARGDGKKAKHLVEYAIWAIKADVTICSVQDPQTFGDLLYTVVTGQRNYEDSARKSKAVREGLRRRRESGKPVGRIPLGYTREQRDEHGEAVRDGRGDLVTERVRDPDGAEVYERMASMVERGSTFGNVARTLNREGVRGVRGCVPEHPHGSQDPHERRLHRPAGATRG